VSSKPRTDDEDRRLKALGQAIRDVRKAHNVSQEALAHSAGIDRSHMGKIERGERNVTALNLFRIADALGVHPAEIFSNPERSTLV
jgi:transcriptional regulator with XRE-family HTH domain